MLILSITMATYIMLALLFVNFHFNQEKMFVKQRKKEIIDPKKNMRIIKTKSKSNKMKPIKKCRDMKRLFKSRLIPSFKNVKIIGK